MPGLLLLGLLTGCTSGWEGIWVLTIPFVDDTDACATTVTENYANADVPPEDDPVGPWTYTDALENSDSLLVIEVLDARGANVLLVLLDQVYTGTVEGGVLTVGWTDSTVDTAGQTHDSGYSFTSETSTETVETIRLEKNGDVGGASGSYEAVSTTAFAWTESDEWQVGQTGVYSSQIPSFLYLEGAGATSESNAVDCAGGVCTLDVSLDCTYATDVTALDAGRDRDGTFAAIENAGQ